MKIQSLPVPMQKEEYATSTGAGDAEPLPDMENCCGESCVTGASKLESGAGMPTEDQAVKDAPIRGTAGIPANWDTL
ncbi:hypothetical protein H6G96_32500 [Nostoc sp. FACHB-892]|uniref:hypothetical protein n=1 Tax=Nostoc sp. FACHB-892 TaxID=2692843 RepID=UPI0016866F76|nr:hypothetical protein [Nostoc sp. FACHB-892]MBD2730913.1 hypothetical protein [Nostoc sp. FACHB-892]